MSGAGVLVAEDQILVAMMIEDLVLSCGYRVVGTVSDVARGLAMLEEAATTIDAAVLDVDLGDGLVYPLAEALQARGIPFCFVSAFQETEIAPRFDGVPSLGKPVDRERLAAILREMVAVRRA